MSDVKPDRLAHREWLASLTTLPSNGLVVDFGCGRGDDLRLLASRHAGPGVRLIGVDASAASIAAAEASFGDDGRVTFRLASLDDRLPFDDASVDLAYSHNLLECLADPSEFAREIARVLRPGGQVVVAHWDWDTQLFDASDKALVRGLVAAYADWQQAWMAHADGWMGRRLHGIFHATSAFDGTLDTRVLTNTVYAPGWFGYENAQAMRSLARRGLASDSHVEQFLAEQHDLAARGRYFYGITGFAFVGRRRVHRDTSP